MVLHKSTNTAVDIGNVTMGLDKSVFLVDLPEAGSRCLSEHLDIGLSQQLHAVWISLCPLRRLLCSALVVRRLGLFPEGTWISSNGE